MIQLELPNDLQEFVDAKVQAGQFASAGEYIVSLIDAARGATSSLEAALIEGLKSGPAEEWTGQEWQEMRQRVIERHQ